MSDRGVVESVVQLMRPYAVFSHQMADFCKGLRQTAGALEDGNPSKSSMFAVAQAVEGMMLTSGLTLEGKRKPGASEAQPTVVHYPVGNVTHADFSADRLLKHTRAAK